MIRLLAIEREGGMEDGRASGSAVAALGVRADELGGRELEGFEDALSLWRVSQ